MWIECSRTGLSLVARVARAWRLVALLVAPITVTAQPADTAAVYEHWRDRIVQIQVIDEQAGTKAGTGSGFIAGGPSRAVTNYHVIAELVNRPGKYRARYIAEGGIEGDVELLAVDPVHDLAVLQLSGYQRPPLALADAGPPKGTRLYSLGFPFDIGLTIVEGTFNGTLEKSLYEKMHFTGSINPGMSGGPTVDAGGAVVGVNVATAGNQVSFLVPVRHVAELLQRTGNDAPSEEMLRDQVAKALLDNQSSLARTLLDADIPGVPLDEYRVPGGTSHWLNCWGNSDEDLREDLALVYHHCQTSDDIYLSGLMTTGIVRFQHDLLSTRSLSPWRFWNQMQERSHFPRLRLEGDEESVSNYACQQDFVEHDALPVKAVFCVRGYRRFEGLYDGFVSVTALTEERQALQSTMVLGGFSFDNLQRIGRWFVEAVTLSGREEPR